MNDFPNNLYFKASEFACPCCGEIHIDPEFLNMLTVARAAAGIPFTINSGYRCAKRNADIPQSSQTSAHLTGQGADIRCMTSRERFVIIDALLKAGFKRIGIGAQFVHCDIKIHGKIQDVIWTYYD